MNDAAPEIERDEDGHPVCTEARPWRPEDGTPAVHPSAREVGEQEPGWPAGDVVTYECPLCGQRWRAELPQ